MWWGNCVVDSPYLRIFCKILGKQKGFNCLKFPFQDCLFEILWLSAFLIVPVIRIETLYIRVAWTWVRCWGLRATIRAAVWWGWSLSWTHNFYPNPSMEYPSKDLISIVHLKVGYFGIFKTIYYKSYLENVPPSPRKWFVIVSFILQSSLAFFVLPLRIDFVDPLSPPARRRRKWGSLKDTNRISSWYDIYFTDDYNNSTVFPHMKKNSPCLPEFIIDLKNHSLSRKECQIPQNSPRCRESCLHLLWILCSHSVRVAG